MKLSYRKIVGLSLIIVLTIFAFNIIRPEDGGKKAYGADGCTLTYSDGTTEAYNSGTDYIKNAKTIKIICSGDFVLPTGSVIAGNSVVISAPNITIAGKIYSYGLYQSTHLLPTNGMPESNDGYGAMGGRNAVYGSRVMSREYIAGGAGGGNGGGGSGSGSIASDRLASNADILRGNDGGSGYLATNYRDSSDVLYGYIEAMDENVLYALMGYNGSSITPSVTSGSDIFLSVDRNSGLTPMAMHGHGGLPLYASGGPLVVYNDFDIGGGKSVNKQNSVSGGRVKLAATGTINLNNGAVINVDGTNGIDSQGYLTYSYPTNGAGGGGAGGTIILQGNIIASSGTVKLSAQGGNGGHGSANDVDNADDVLSSPGGGGGGGIVVSSVPISGSAPQVTITGGLGGDQIMLKSTGADASTYGTYENSKFFYAAWNINQNRVRIMFWDTAKRQGHGGDGIKTVATESETGGAKAVQIEKRTYNSAGLETATFDSGETVYVVVKIKNPGTSLSGMKFTDQLPNGHPAAAGDVPANVNWTITDNPGVISIDGGKWPVPSPDVELKYHYTLP